MFDARRYHGPTEISWASSVCNVWLESDFWGAGRICTTVHIMPAVVEWDREKAEANRVKHGVDFADAATVLTDDLALTRPDDNPDEERFVTLGMDALGRVLVVAYAWHEDELRLISARKATPSERRQYERRR